MEKYEARRLTGGAVLGGVWLTFVLSAVAQSGNFQQDPLADGVISLEAEHFHTSTTVDGHSWVVVTTNQASGDQVVIASPNVGTRNNEDYDVNSPRMDYRVNFVKTGIHYVVARGSSPSGDDDSFHVGLDGVPNLTSDRMFGFYSVPEWRGDTMDDTNAYFNVSFVGEHVVNVWMREDGMVLDKLLITTNPNFFPAYRNEGPPESVRVDEGAESSSDGPVLLSASLSNGMVYAEFDPIPMTDQYMVMAKDGPNGALVSDPLSSVQGFSVFGSLSSAGSRFFGLEGIPVPSNTVFATTLLSRLAYGTMPGAHAVVESDPEGYIQRQLAPETIVDDPADANPNILFHEGQLQSQRAFLWDLRSWYCLRAVHSDRQLFEVLTQFWNNHFVTYYWKTRDWLEYEAGLSYNDASYQATELELQELERWRSVLMDPDGTFYDLLEISAESPSMIIYLDTVSSVKEGPNENYSREILELFCMGVDNGYEQEDIVELSRAWTGWTVSQVASEEAGNPHAPLKTNDTIVVAPTSTEWLYRKGTNEPDAAWTTVGFSPGPEWVAGQTSMGHGYDDNTDLSDMEGNYSSVYLRHPFEVSDVAEFEELRIGLYVDDGCVAYINGQEIARFSVPPGPLSYDSLAYSHKANTWEYFTVSDASSVVQEGNNVLAIHMLNARLENPDVTLDASLFLSGVWSFVFDSSNHDSYSNKVIFADRTIDARFGPPWAGQPYELVLDNGSGEGGIQDGYQIMEHLAELPYTAEFVSVKLCQLFVHDDFSIGNYYNVTNITPEAQLIKDCIMAWETTGNGGRKGNLRAVLNTIFQSKLFRSQQVAQQKVKTPFEYVVSAIRALRYDLGGGQYGSSTDGYDLTGPMQNMGMELFARSQPNGWPETGRAWIDTSTMAERLRFVQNYLMSTNDPLKDVDYGDHGAANESEPVAILQAAAANAEISDLRDPEEVSRFFSQLLYPSEGFANLDLDVDECTALLNSDATGTPNNPAFDALAVESPEYDQRVRGLVGLLLANPRFHEQ